jgi:hypothetical protein
MSTPLSPEVSGLITQLSELSVGLKNGQAGAREGLLGACSALISELAHPMESILMLMWAQVHFYSYQASKYPHSNQNALAYTSRCSSPKNVEQLAVPGNAEPLLVCEFTSIDPNARRTVSL